MAQSDEPPSKIRGQVDPASAPSGGTYDQEDLSEAAQRSRVRQQKPEQLAPKENPQRRSGS